MAKLGKQSGIYQQTGNEEERYIQRGNRMQMIILVNFMNTFKACREPRRKTAVVMVVGDQGRVT